MIDLKARALDVLAGVQDPEVPVNIVEMGLVKSVAVGDDGHLEVELAPCYAACPGRTYMLERARSLLHELDPEATVSWSAEPYWRSTLLTPAARHTLREFGVGVKEPGAADLECPFCGSHQTRPEKEFGSTVSLSLFYCDACRNPFEALRGSW